MTFYQIQVKNIMEDLANFLIGASYGSVYLGDSCPTYTRIYPALDDPTTNWYKYRSIPEFVKYKGYKLKVCTSANDAMNAFNCGIPKLSCHANHYLIWHLLPYGNNRGGCLEDEYRPRSKMLEPCPGHTKNCLTCRSNSTKICGSCFRTVSTIDNFCMHCCNNPDQNTTTCSTHKERYIIRESSGKINSSCKQCQSIYNQKESIQDLENQLLKLEIAQLRKQLREKESRLSGSDQAWNDIMRIFK